MPAEVDFQLTIDATPVPGGNGLSLDTVNAPQTGSLLARIQGLAAGPHTVTLQWRVTNGQTAQIRPFTQPGRESAAVLAMETLV